MDEIADICNNPLISGFQLETYFFPTGRIFCPNWPIFTFSLYNTFHGYFYFVKIIYFIMTCWNLNRHSDYTSSKIIDVFDERRRITCLILFNLLTSSLVIQNLTRACINASPCTDPETSLWWHSVYLEPYNNQKNNKSVKTFSEHSTELSIDLDNKKKTFYWK